MALPPWAKYVPHWLHKSLRLLVWARRLRTGEAILCAERTSTILKRLPGRCPALIHIPHGAGDRAVGFEARFRYFDRVLVAGAKDRDRLIADGVVDHRACVIVGPVKVAAMLRMNRQRHRLFENSRPTLLYNPHFSRKLRSIDAFGEKLIQAVVRDGRYNLIVAPHIRLAQSWTEAEREKWQALSVSGQVIVDLASDRLIDMTYTLAADLYIGDVSSQVYEFVTRSRPCLFVNAHAAVWDGNPDYAMWKLGEVVAPDCDPLVAIDRAWASFPGYADVQKSRARATLDAIDWHEDGTALLRGDDPIVRAANEVADTVAMENGPQVVPGDRDGDAAGRGLLARAGFEAAQ